MKYFKFIEKDIYRGDRNLIGCQHYSFFFSDDFKNRCWITEEEANSISNLSASKKKRINSMKVGTQLKMSYLHSTAYIYLERLPDDFGEKLNKIKELEKNLKETQKKIKKAAGDLLKEERSQRKELNNLKESI